MGVNLSGTTPRDPSGPTNIVDEILRGAGGLGDGLAGGFSGLIGGIGDAIRGIFTPGGLFAPVGEAAQEIRDGQLDLEGRTDLLSPLLDYGSAFISQSAGGSGTGWGNFNTQLGPMQGCELIRDSQGGIMLLDKGLWDIRVQMTLREYWSVTESGIGRIELRIYAPDGELFSQQWAIDSATTSMSLSVNSSVVVPESGYRVRAWLWSQGSNRGWFKGPMWTRLSVQHISRDVNGPWAKGTEPSDSI